MAIDQVLHQVLRWINSAVASGSCVKLNEMGVWKMNERIQKLAEQAGIKEELVVMFKGDKRAYVLSKDDVEKFAELIVKECARVDSEENNPDHVDGETYNQTILQHFGVEE